MLRKSSLRLSSPAKMDQFKWQNIWLHCWLLFFCYFVTRLFCCVTTIDFHGVVSFDFYSSCCRISAFIRVSYFHRVWTGLVMASAIGTPGPRSPFSQIPVSSPKLVLFVGDSFVTCFSRSNWRELLVNERCPILVPLQSQVLRLSQRHHHWSKMPIFIKETEPQNLILW